MADKSELARLYHHAPNAIAVSARTGEGVGQLEARVVSHLSSVEDTVDILVPHTAGALRSEIRKLTTVLAEDHTEEGALMQILANPRLLGRLLAKGAQQNPKP